MEHRTCEYEDSLYLKGALDLEHMFKRWVGGYRRVGQCVFLPSLNKNNISRDVLELARALFPTIRFYGSQGIFLFVFVFQGKPLEDARRTFDSIQTLVLFRKAKNEKFISQGCGFCLSQNKT